MLGYEATVRAMRAQHIPEEKIQKFAREQWPEIAAQQDAAAVKRADILEKEEQGEVVKIFKALGCKVYNLSQSRASKQSPGLSDLWVVCLALRRAWWWETKRQVGAHFSLAQELFATECETCGIDRGAGDRHAATQWVIGIGLATMVNGVLEPTKATR